jgi:hypothetical protein
MNDDTEDGTGSKRPLGFPTQIALLSLRFVTLRTRLNGWHMEGRGPPQTLSDDAISSPCYTALRG